MVRLLMVTGLVGLPTSKTRTRLLPLIVRALIPRPVIVSSPPSVGRALASVIVWPVRLAAKLMVSPFKVTPKSVSAWVMAERRVTVPAGGAAMSAALLTVIVDSTHRSSRSSSRGRTKWNDGFRAESLDFGNAAHLQGKKAARIPQSLDNKDGHP